MAEMDKDATACYDRIVVSLSNQRDQQLGMPEGPCAMVGEVLQNATYRVKTQLGLSSQTYQCSDKTPIHRTGQGAQHSAPKWRGVSTLGLDVLNEHHEGAVFTTPRPAIKTARTMDKYVDDAASWMNRFMKQ